MKEDAKYDQAVPDFEKDPEQTNPSRRSLRGLDWINFFLADVGGGVGPYLSAFLKGAQHWQPSDIGVAMAAATIAAAICQIPAGLLVDGLKIKRLLVAGSGLLIGVGCLLIAFFPVFSLVIAVQAMLGAASAVIPPAIAALSLGLVGHRLLDARISRNQVFNHGGNFVAAGLAGTLGQNLGYVWIFYLVCIFAVASTVAVHLIKPGEIDHDLARGSESVERNGRPLPFRDLLRQSDLMIFLSSVVLFHFGNAAMLPMAGQVLALSHPGSDAATLSACIIIAQLVMGGVAWGVGRAINSGFGRKSIFLVALAILPIRGLLFAFTANPYGIVGIQVLDGVAAGIFGVIAVLIASDLMRGTGRFNLAQGLVALAVGVGAGLSQLTSGFVVQWYGYSTGFLYLAAVAVIAFIFFAVFMPETKDRADKRNPPARQDLVPWGPAPGRIDCRRMDLPETRRDRMPPALILALAGALAFKRDDPRSRQRGLLNPRAIHVPSTGGPVRLTRAGVTQVRPPWPAHPFALWKGQDDRRFRRQKWIHGRSL